ncbi:hypothetical protein CEE45_13185 [Candidatus Heimdallarchaeota archaeon B3_Heim]|nr:MAG: hypothetical protein CEE45_13185 [Candidatus Heimdallarchaeota archaeon B3_Heim]
MGFERIQADLFNSNTGSNVSAVDIEQKIIKNKKDPRLLRYAFTDENKPLAYIQASQVSSKVFYLGYPWCTADCSPDVQNKLFSDMLVYLKSKNPDEIQYWIKTQWSKVREFFTERGFILKVKGLDYSFDIEKLSNQKLDDKTKYKSRLATTSDIDSLIELGRVDKELQEAGLTEEFFQDYFKNKVLKDGHCIIISQESQDVCASAPLLDQPSSDKPRLVLRFTATRPGFEDSWPLLLTDIARECKMAGWERYPLHFNTEEGSEIAKTLVQFKPKITDNYSLFTLELAK